MKDFNLSKGAGAQNRTKQYNLFTYGIMAGHGQRYFWSKDSNFTLIYKLINGHKPTHSMQIMDMGLMGNKCILLVLSKIGIDKSPWTDKKAKV